MTAPFAKRVLAVLLILSAGADQVSGGSGVDSIVGGIGVDVYFGQTAVEKVFGEDVEGTERDDDIFLG